MKSLAQKRREARERIERHLPAAELRLKQLKEAFELSITPPALSQQMQDDLAREYGHAKRWLDYAKEEIERIKYREANPKARRVRHDPEIPA